MKRKGLTSVQLRPKIAKMVASLMAREGMTMVVVTHEMGFAREAGDRIVFMEAGRIVEMAPTELFFSAPREGRTRAFLGQIL